MTPEAASPELDVAAMLEGSLRCQGQAYLPFGGVGETGMGHYHGREGFATFSKLRPVFHQARLSSTRLLAPPYGRLADRIVAFLLR